MTKEVLEHLCEAFLFGSLYQSDFVLLLHVEWKHEKEFCDELWDWYEKRHEANKWKEDYVEWWKWFAKYLLSLVEKWEEA